MFVSEADLRAAGHGLSTSTTAVFGSRDPRPIPAWVRDDVAVVERVERKAGGPHRSWWLTLADLLTDVADLTEPPRPTPPLGLLLGTAETLRAALGRYRLAEPPAAERRLLDEIELLTTAAAHLAESLDSPWTVDDDLAAQLEDLLDALYGYAADRLAHPTELPSCGPAPLTLPTVRGAGYRRQGRPRGRPRTHACRTRPRPHAMSRNDSRGPP